MLPSEVQSALKQAVREQLGDLVFRRVGCAKSSNRNFKRALRFEFDVKSSKATSRSFSRDEIPRNEEEICKNWEFRYDTFYGFAEPAGPYGIRDNDPSPDEEIYFNSAEYSELDVAQNGTFKFKACPRQVIPRAGDLVCGIVKKSSRPGRKPRYAKWFSCSEQFLRAWTLLMYDRHEAFTKNQEASLKRHSLSGNRLNTNSFLKWFLTLKGNNMTVPQEEASKRYFHLRTEFVSRQWVHVYTALVLMVRWGELPCRFNVPQNLDNSPRMQQWNLPRKFVSTFLQKWTCLSPRTWGYDSWSQLELAIREEYAVYEQDSVESIDWSEEEFPPLGSTAPPEPPKDAISELFDKMEGSGQMSWADVMDAEEEESLTESNSFSSDSPSEGGDARPVYVVVVSAESSEVLGTFEDKEKALRRLLDWVAVEITDGHHGDSQSRHTGLAPECELCELRRFKTEQTKEEEESRQQFTLWDGRVGYLEQKVLE